RRTGSGPIVDATKPPPMPRKPQQCVEALLLDDHDVGLLENLSCLESTTMKWGLDAEIATLHAMTQKALLMLRTRQKLEWKLLHHVYIQETLKQLRRYNDLLY